MPVYHGMYAHKVRPAAVGPVEMLQVCTMRIGAPGADEDGADLWVVVEVIGKCFFHRLGIAGERQVVAFDGFGDEVVYGFERVFTYYVD